MTKALDQQGVNLGLTATYFIFTLAGSYIIDKFRRRTLIFTGLISIILLQTASTITGWQYSLHETSAASGLTIMWMFLFQIMSSLMIATMHNLYPVEILSLTLRAKGMGLYSFIQGAAGTVQSYGISVGISKLGYKIWCVYIIYNTLQLIAAYLVFPETFGLSLEEIGKFSYYPSSLSMHLTSLQMLFSRRPEQSLLSLVLTSRRRKQRRPSLTGKLLRQGMLDESLTRICSEALHDADGV